MVVTHLWSTLLKTGCPRGYEIRKIMFRKGSQFYVVGPSSFSSTTIEALTAELGEIVDKQDMQRSRTTG